MEVEELRGLLSERITSFPEFFSESTPHSLASALLDHGATICDVVQRIGVRCMPAAS